LNQGIKQPLGTISIIAGFIEWSPGIGATLQPVRPRCNPLFKKRKFNEVLADKPFVFSEIAMIIFVQ